MLLSGSFLMGEKKAHNKIPPPKKTRDNPVKFLFTCFFSLCVFFAPKRLRFVLAWSSRKAHSSVWKAQARGYLTLLATRAAIYRSLRTLRARSRKEVSKKVFFGVRRKVSKNTRKSQKIPIFGHFARGIF